jgi:hypothetical protein
MPSDLRHALIARMSDMDRETVRDALEALSFSSISAAHVDRLGAATVVRVRKAPPAWAARWNDWRRGLPSSLAEHDLQVVKLVEPPQWSELEHKLLLAAIGVTSLWGFWLGFWFISAMGWY